MLKRQNGWSVRIAAVVGLFLLSAGLAQAAGEWEWTKSAGWTQGAGSARPTPREQLQYAYELEQRSEFMDSARQYFLLIQAFPASQEAGVGLQRLARCLFEMENYFTSYQAIEQVIKDYPNTGRMSDLVEIELRIAKKMMVSQTPDLFAAPTADPRSYNIRRALEIVDSVIEHDPYGPVAPEAYLVKGEGHLFINEIQQARTSFEKLRDEFPKSEYVERARLGILTCDSLVGQASPQELQDQIELVRERERERLETGRGDADEDDEVESFIRKQNEVEAAKMLDQANQYHQMGTGKTVRSAQFMYNEIIRRYPDTPQAEEALDRLGKSKAPREPGKLAKALRGVNINPFVINKDPEPPWIVPQLSADDVVMVDQGMGPIAGVPETGMGPPPVQNTVHVRPATLPESGPEAAEANFSPAPEFVDGTRSVAGGYSPIPNMAQGGQPSVNVPPPSPYNQPQQPAGSRNPLPGTESDLIGVPAGSSGSYYSSAPIPDISPGYNGGQPTLSAPLWNTPDSDLVGVAPRSYDYPPIPEYGTASYITTTDPQPGSYYPTPQPMQTYQAPMYQEPAPGYEVPGGLRQGSRPSSGASANGGWTFGDEFR